MVVGLGPAGPDLVPPGTIDVLTGVGRRFVRTGRHPALDGAALASLLADATTFDAAYDSAAPFDEVYRSIVEDLVAAAGELASSGASIAYAVPGSPLVAERTVELLRADGRVDVEVHPALSFLDLIWARLAVDPLSSGVRLVDATVFATQAAGSGGPLLVAQCHSRAVLSDVKLAVDDPGGTRVVLLHHVGLPDEAVVEVAWADLDRTIEPDHLTSLWVPELAVPAAAELVRLEELVRVLRARCPWDMCQTHGSLARHLQEEVYEALEAIEVVAAAGDDPPAAAVDHLVEELGDVLVQVVFHAVLAGETGWFDLGDVARGVHDKLVARHPHVFGDAVAGTPEEVAARWEVMKQAEKGRASVFDGVPAALPALALAAKMQRKAESTGRQLPGLGDRLDEVLAGVAALRAGGSEVPHGSGETLQEDPATVEVVGAVLFALADAARRLGADPESALRSAAGRFRAEVERSAGTTVERSAGATVEPLPSPGR